MAEPFRYVVDDEDEDLVIPVRLGDGSTVTFRILAGSVLYLDGVLPARGDGGGTGNRTPPA